MSRNRRALDRAASTAEPYHAALQWVKTHRGDSLIPEVAGEQADLEHDLYQALIERPGSLFTVAWAVPDADTITVHLDPDCVSAALTAILPHLDAAAGVTGVPAVRCTPDGGHLMLTRGAATAHLRSTVHLHHRLDALRSPEALWPAGIPITDAEQFLLRTTASRTDDDRWGSGRLRRIGEVQRDHQDRAAQGPGYVADAGTLGPAAPRVRGGTDRLGDPISESLAGRLLGHDSDVVYLPSLFVQAPLPHAGGPVERHLALNTGAMTVWMRAGDSNAFGGAEMQPSLPLGVAGRLVLIWLTTEIARTRHAVVTVPGRLLTGALGARIRGQLLRLAAMQVTVEYRPSGVEYRLRERGAAFALATSVHGDGDMTVTVTQAFLTEALRALVPLPVRAIRALADQSLALDLYAMIVLRLAGLQRTVLLPWDALPIPIDSAAPMARQRVCTALARVMAVYPDARIIIGDDGLTLQPSPPSPTRLRQPTPPVTRRAGSRM